MARAEKFRAAMKIRGIKIVKLAELYGLTRMNMTYLIGKESMKKPEIDKLAELLDMRYTSQFVVDGKIITGLTFTDMIKELMAVTGKSYDAFSLVLHSRQNAFERINRGKFTIDDLQNIAIHCGGNYEERYYIDGIEI